MILDVIEINNKPAPVGYLNWHNNGSMSGVIVFSAEDPTNVKLASEIKANYTWSQYSGYAKYEK